ncbi:hypothetical protein [Rhizobium anhuiense]|uniref:hypothetical protein n=1 Tax=Rhizobium anhuiense TaxID=1184720 RepID=UPI00315A48C3
MGATVCAMTYGNVALAHDSHAAGLPTQISLKELVKVAMLEERLELFSDVCLDVEISIRQFLNKFLSPIKDEKYVLGVPAGEKVTTASAGECFQLRRYKEGGREEPDGESFSEW